METKNKDIRKIVSNILPLNPYRIVLFGSHAEGTQDAESDIDLLVVLDSDSIAQNYDERMNRRLMVRNSVREINKRIPMDILVYTRAEYQYLKSQEATFVDNIESNGKTLYEKAG